MRRVALALLLLGGCATVKEQAHIYGNVVQRAGLADATWFVWQYYGHDDMPPLVSVVEAPYLTCADGKGFTIPVAPKCVYGVTTSPWTVSVAYTGTKWSETSLAHELLHAHEWTTGTPNPGHLGPDWEPGGLLDKANNALSKAGM